MTPSKITFLALTPFIFALTAWAAPDLPTVDDGGAAIFEPNAPDWPAMINGEVTDETGNPIPHVSLAFNGVEYRSDQHGRFSIESTGSGNLIIKKPGYQRVIIGRRTDYLRVQLKPQTINAVYVAPAHFKNKTGNVRKFIDNLLRTTELNGVVLDIKNDDGILSGGYESILKELRERGVYSIARIVAFKDTKKAAKNPELALLNKNTKKPWTDPRGNMYLNPFNKLTHLYVLELAIKAIEMGFDEIEFDYIRFPSDGKLSDILWPWNEEEKHLLDNMHTMIESKEKSRRKTAAIVAFLESARLLIAAKGAFVAADVFGDTVNNHTGSGIGQNIEDITPHVDYVCPMVYPSGYGPGAAGFKIPVDHPKEVVADSVRRYRIRADKLSVVRPWLQAFKDYAYKHRPVYGPKEICAQIAGSDENGGDGWLLWNAASDYSKTVGCLKPPKQVIP